MALEKAEIIPINTYGMPIKVLFNPSDCAIEKVNLYHDVEIPGLDAPLIQFIRGGAEYLSMQLFFDTFEEETDVRDEFVRPLLSLIESDPELHAPPVVLFSWGVGIQFTAVLEEATVKYSMFMENGTPVRASVDVRFKQFYFGRAEEIKRSPDYSKWYVVKEGETLSAIAWQMYNNPQEWRPIADANGIENPRFLASGTRLYIPPLRGK
ncbi:MAG: LysM peptidoglycan-binding domain-containing protein [bacterium]